MMNEEGDRLFSWGGSCQEKENSVGLAGGGDFLRAWMTKDADVRPVADQAIRPRSANWPSQYPCTDAMLGAVEGCIAQNIVEVLERGDMDRVVLMQRAGNAHAKGRSPASAARRARSVSSPP